MQVSNTTSFFSSFIRHFITPEICNRKSIADLTRFKSVASLRLAFHHNNAMLSKPNFLIYCGLSLHYESYCIIRVKTQAGFPGMKLGRFYESPNRNRPVICNYSFVMPCPAQTYLWLWINLSFLKG